MSDDIAVEESTSATSLARTVTSPPAVTVLSSTAAVAELDTFELATTAPLLVPAAPNIAAGAEVAALPTSEWTTAALTAETSTEPEATSVEPDTRASASGRVDPVERLPDHRSADDGVEPGEEEVRRLPADGGEGQDDADRIGARDRGRVGDRVDLGEVGGIHDDVAVGRGEVGVGDRGREVGDDPVRGDRGADGEGRARTVEGAAAGGRGRRVDGGPDEALATGEHARRWRR